MRGAFYPDKGAGDFFLFTKDTGGDEFTQIYRFDEGTGAATLLTDGGRSQNGGIRWSTAGDRVAYGSTRRNGRDRDLYVMDPRDPKTDRRLLEVEGGGWRVLDWSPDDRRLLVQQFLSINEDHLWIVLGYGKTFLKLDDGRLREDSVKDIGALLDWIRTRPELDADRVMISGGSYGGYMALAVAVHYGDRIRCALDLVGISNFISFLERTEPYRQDLRRAEYGDERDPAMRAFFEQIAPLRNAHKIVCPLFVVQGENDPRVPKNESEQMVATVKRGGTPVWYLAAKDEGHGFVKKKNLDFQFYATVLFMQEYLLK